jgi:hypothetical protein
MPFPLIFTIPGQSHIKVRPILIENTECTVADLKKIIIEQLKITNEDIEKMDFQFPGNRIREVTKQDTQTLSELGIKDSNSAKLVLKVGKPIELQDTAQQKLKEQLAKEKIIAEENMKAAQDGLKNALKNAQTADAHVIITVGSYVNAAHDDDSVRRQQFPTERLGDINSNDKIHLVHIDPGFKGKPSPLVKQYHEEADWTLVRSESHGLINTYTKDNYTITTIAHSILDKGEGEAYFNAGEPVKSVLGVDISEASRVASAAGNGFITGNFYASDAKPVIDIQPVAPESDLTHSM